MSDSKPITIVHIITSLGVGGAERVLSNLVLGMNREKFCNIVISLQDLGHWGSILQQQGIQVYALHMRSNLSSGFKLFTLWKLLRELKPDYVQGWMYHANVIALIVGKLAGVKHILWNIRCSLMDLSKYKFSTAMIFNSGAWLARFPSAIINNSHKSIQQHYSLGYKNKNNIYLPNGFDTELFKPNAAIYRDFRGQHKLPSNAIIIGMVARFDPMKDHATFLKAAGLLAKQRDDIYFVCAGRNVNWFNKELINIIADYSLHGRVLLFDQVNNLQELYPAFDYLTQTSIFGEGFPNVIAEAMACGVECFATDVGDSLEVIGELGYPIPKQNHQALAQQWLQIINDRSTLNASRNEQVRARIVNKFSLPNVIRQYADIYRNLA